MVILLAAPKAKRGPTRLVLNITLEHGFFPAMTTVVPSADNRLQRKLNGNGIALPGRRTRLPLPRKSQRDRS